VSFAKAHHNVLPKTESGRGHRLGELFNILGFPFNISATTKGSDFKIGRLVGFAKAHQKSNPEEKDGVALS